MNLRRLPVVLLLALVMALGGLSPAAPILAAGSAAGPTPPAWGIHLTPPLNMPGNNFSDQLLYQNYHGPVMVTNTVYTIFWVPPGYSFAYPADATVGYTGDPTGQHFAPYVNQYVQDVAADSGKTTNPYSTATQYYQNAPGPKQFIQYNVTFGGSVVDTNPFPPNNCQAPYVSTCIDDVQVQNEVARVVDAQGWPRGVSAMYLLFTPMDVGACGATFSGCTGNSFCAYHEWYSDTNGTLVFSYIWDSANSLDNCSPFAHTSASGDVAADAAVGSISHEQIEAMTDPLLSAWWDRWGNEIGDKCGWNFGTIWRDSKGAPINNMINGHPYLLQEEFSNKTSSCVQSGY